MEREVTYSEALQRCQFLAAKSECCTYDLAQKMYRWGVSAEVSQKVIASLVEDRFVDDLRYATAYVRDKTRLNHWGRVKTTMMLRQKRISQEIVNEAFNEMPDTDYIRAFEVERDKKLKQLRALQPFERNRKTAAYLIQKGFEPDFVFRNLDDR